ncbi:hypothetical protein SLS58_003092 [Diplodia intermedia]|uniref:Uncharacterized protein n=1 Tax=Diplodia intermedia TaxID=856260 RepID=A0ABR3TXN6_9PEZI
MNTHRGYSSIDIGRDNVADLLEMSKHPAVRDDVHAHIESPVRPTRLQKLKDHWAWETSSLAVSMVTIVAISIVLRILDGKPLSWWKSSISPNSLVSIFAAISKSAMLLSVTECIGQAKWLYFSRAQRRLYDLQLFDDASRGPLGSLIFLCQSVVNVKDILTSVAAMVMIAALAVDPFMQQIIKYHIRSVPTQEASGATTPSTSMYDSGVLMDSTQAKSIFAGIDMQSAIVTGLLSTSVAPTYYCSTGNCTWPDITKFGVCSTCTNVTSSSPKTCTARDASTSTQTCHYTTPSNINITSTNGLGANGTWTYLNTTADPTFTATDQPLMRFAILRSPPTADVDATGVQPADIAECTFHYCAQTTSAFRIDNGVLRPGTTASTPLNIAFAPSGEWIPYTANNRIYATLSPDTTTSTNTTNTTNTTFHIHTADLGIARTLLTNILATSLSSFNTDADTAKFQTAPLLLFAADLSATLANIAASMSDLMQRCDNGSLVVGAAVRDETFVRVRWACSVILDSR